MGGKGRVEEGRGGEGRERKGKNRRDEPPFSKSWIRRWSN